jgi:hypothetical protein
MTELEQTGRWTPNAGNHLAEGWEEWAALIPLEYQDEPGFHRGIKDNLQQVSSFHSKKEGHQRTAVKIFSVVVLSA